LPTGVVVVIDLEGDIGVVDAGELGARSGAKHDRVLVDHEVDREDPR
jgi:hypothetical protein